MIERYDYYTSNASSGDRSNRWADVLEQCAIATGMFVVRLNSDLNIISGPFAPTKATALFSDRKFWTPNGKILQQLLPYIENVTADKVPIVTPVLQQLAVAIVPQISANQVVGLILCGLRPLRFVEPALCSYIAQELEIDEDQLQNSLQQYLSVPLEKLHHLVKFLEIITVTISDAETQSIRDYNELKSLAVINKVSLTLAGTEDLQQIVSCVFDALPSLLNVKAATLYIQRSTESSPFQQSVVYDPHTYEQSATDPNHPSFNNCIQLSLDEGQYTDQNWLVIAADELATGTVPDSLSLLALQTTTALTRLRNIDLLARERTRLDSAVQNLNRSLTAKDEFLSMVSHELRTPLNAILGWAQMIRSGICVDPLEIEEAASTIERNAQKQARIVSELIDSSRFNTGKVALDIDTIALSDLIEQVIDSILPAATAKSTVVQSYGLHEKIEIKGDALRIQQALWNLVSNAIKFTPVNGQVSIYLFQDGDSAVIQVKDNGIGIEPRYLPLLFDRFSQQDSSNDRYFGGLGLGMSNTKNVVELHGGRIEASSPGQSQGSTFTIYLPIGSSGKVSRLIEPAPPVTASTDITEQPIVY